MGGKQLLASAAHRLRTDDPGLGGGCLQKSWYGYHTTCSVSMIIDINIWIFNPFVWRNNSEDWLISKADRRAPFTE